MQAHNNSNLTCIQVDDVDFANSQVCGLPNYDGWCKDETASYSEFCELGVEDVTISKIVLFPNPATNILTIQTELDIDSARIYSIQGVLVKEFQKTKKLDVSLLTEGVYFVEIVSNGSSSITRFIKS